MITVFTDGLCKGNPGKGAFGAVIFDENNKLIGKCGSFESEETTNNVMEYRAVISALAHLIMNGRVDNILIKSDSQLMVNQLNGVFLVKNDKIKTMYEHIKNDLESNFTQVSYEWIPREENKLADEYANEIFKAALDNGKF